jgi:hypothetical protein
MNSKQRRKALRSKYGKLNAFQMQLWRGLERMKRRSKWLKHNPLGSRNNPHICSPLEAKILEQEFGYINLAKTREG